MFFTSKQREEIYAKFYEQELLILQLKDRISHLEHILRKEAPWGLKQDGTPRAKPGMKTGQKKVVNK